MRRVHGCLGARAAGKRCRSENTYGILLGITIKFIVIDILHHLTIQQVKVLVDGKVYRTFYKCCGCTTSTTTSTMSPWLSLNRSLANEGGP